jgi:hypothetical protein
MTRGFHSIPNLPWRCIVAIEFHGGRCDGGSVPFLGFCSVHGGTAGHPGLKINLEKSR